MAQRGPSCTVAAVRSKPAKRVLLVKVLNIHYVPYHTFDAVLQWLVSTGKYATQDADAAEG